MSTMEVMFHVTHQTWPMGVVSHADKQETGKVCDAVFATVLERAVDVEVTSFRNVEGKWLVALRRQSLP